MTFVRQGTSPSVLCCQLAQLIICCWPSLFSVDFKVFPVVVSVVRYHCTKCSQLRAGVWFAIWSGAIALTAETDPTIFSIQCGKGKLEPTSQAAEPLATCTSYLVWVLSLSCLGIRVVWSNVN